MPRSYRFTFACVAGIALCAWFMRPYAWAAPEKIDFKLSLIKEDFYFFKGDFEAMLSFKDQSSSGKFDRELGFQGDDILNPNPKDSALTVISPERAAIIALYKIPQDEYKSGKTISFTYQWASSCGVKAEFTFAGAREYNGIQYQAVDAEMKIANHPNLDSALSVTLTGYYSPQNRRFEAVEFTSVKGALKHVPLWYAKWPGFEASAYAYEAKGVLRLIHSRFIDDMPLSYSDDTVELGVNFLLDKQEKEGGWSGSRGTTAMVLCALLKSGVPPDHPAMVRGFEYILLDYDKADPQDHYNPNIYSSCLICMYAFSNLEWLEKLDADKLRQIQKIVRYAADAIEKAFYKNGDGWGDMSRDQYAVMGLFNATATHWYKPEKELLERIWNHYKTMQQKNGPELILIENHRERDEGYGKALEGETVVIKQSLVQGTTVKTPANGWPYKKGESYTGSMTCAGVASLSFVKIMMEQNGFGNDALKKDMDSSLRQARAWLQKNFTVTRKIGNPGHKNSNRTYLYYLYGMERACTMAGWEFLGAHDWYREGAFEIMRIQEATGRWLEDQKGCPEEAATSYCLLFLRRGSLKFKQAQVGFDKVTTE